MRKNCETCSKPFDAQRRTAKYCSGKCRVQAQRAGGDASTPVTALPRPAEDRGGDVTRAAREELASFGLEVSAAGQVVLALARRIDAADGESGASLAALVKEFRAAMAAALADAEGEADPIDLIRDELRDKRERKRSG